MSCFFAGRDATSVLHQQEGEVHVEQRHRCVRKTDVSVEGLIIISINAYIICDQQNVTRLTTGSSTSVSVYHGDRLFVFTMATVCLYLPWQLFVLQWFGDGTSLLVLPHCAWSNN